MKKTVFTRFRIQAALLVPAAAAVLLSGCLAAFSNTAPKISWAPTQVLTPSNGSEVSNLQPTFSWKRASRATGYQFQLAPNREDLNEAPIVKVTEPTYKPNYDLTMPYYYWRVRAIVVNGFPGAWSEVYGFSVKSVADSFQPKVIAPAASSTVLSDLNAGSTDRFLNKADEGVLRSNAFKVTYSLTALVKVDDGQTLTARLFQDSRRIADASSANNVEASFPMLPAAATLTSGTDLMLKFSSGDTDLVSVKVAAVDTVNPNDVKAVTKITVDNKAVIDLENNDRTLNGSEYQSLSGGKPIVVYYTFDAGQPFEENSVATLFMDGFSLAASETTSSEATFVQAETANLVANRVTGQTSSPPAKELKLKFKDAAGNESKGLTITQVEDEATKALKITKYELNSQALTLTLSKALATRAAIAGNGGFTVKGMQDSTATAFTVSSVAEVQSGVSTLVLNLNRQAAAGETVKLRYDRPESNNDWILDRTDIALGSFGAGIYEDVEVVDIFPPTVTKATLNDKTLTLEMSEPLAARNGSSDTGGFTLTGSVTGETARRFAVTKIAEVEANARELTLTVDNPAKEGETVTLSYTTPATEPAKIKDEAGNALANISRQAVTVADIYPPTIKEAGLNDRVLTLTMSEGLAARDNIPGSGGFTVTGTETHNFEVSDVGAGDAEAKKVVLYLRQPARADETVTLTYTPPAVDSNWIKDVAGNALEAVTSGITVEEKTPPKVIGAELNGLTLTLVMSEEVTIPSSSTDAHGFTIASPGSTVTMQGPEALAQGETSTTLLRFTLSIVEHANPTMRLSYAQPSLSSNRILDSKDNALGSFGDMVIESVGSDALTIKKAELNGTTLTLTMSRLLKARVQQNDNGGFEVKKGDETYEVEKVDAVAVGARTLVLNLKVVPDSTGTLNLYYQPTRMKMYYSDDESQTLASIGANSAITIVRKTPPTITGRKLNGRILTLTLSEALAERGPISGHGGFVVTGSGIKNPTTFKVDSVAAVTLGDTTVELNLSNSAKFGEDVTIHYTRPHASENWITTEVNNNALATMSASETVKVEDTFPPSIEKGEFFDYNKRVKLTFNEPVSLKAGLSGIFSGFVLTPNNNSQPTLDIVNVGVERPGTTTNTVVLVVSTGAAPQGGRTALKADDEYTLTYTRPSNLNHQIKDISNDKNALATLAAPGITVAVKENSDVTNPLIEEAELSVTTVTLTMSEELAERGGFDENSGTGAGAWGFVLTGSGVAVPTVFTVSHIKTVKKLDKTVTLTITGSPKEGETVMLTYTKPQNYSYWIKDLAGNGLASISESEAIPVQVIKSTSN